MSVKAPVKRGEVAVLSPELFLTFRYQIFRKWEARSQVELAELISSSFFSLIHRGFTSFKARLPPTVA